MDRRYSPITDLYGISPPGKPSKNGGRTWLIVLLVLGGAFTYESLQIIMRLRPSPPPGFVGARLDSGKEAYSVQWRMAQDCWNYAIHDLQDKYPYGRPLPESPTAGGVKAPALRVQCWARLQRAWMQKESWRQTYEWNTAWIGKMENTLKLTLRSFWNSLKVNL